MDNVFEGSRTVRVVGRGAFGVVHLCVDKQGRSFISKHIPVAEMSATERQAAMNEVRMPRKHL